MKNYETPKAEIIEFVIEEELLAPGANFSLEKDPFDD